MAFNIICMMTSSNGNIFRVTGPLCGEFTGPGEFPTQRPVTRSFDVFFDVRLIKRLSKHSRGWWFETLSHPLWRHRNGIWRTYFRPLWQRIYIPDPYRELLSSILPKWRCQLGRCKLWMRNSTRKSCWVGTRKWIWCSYCLASKRYM